MDVVFLGAIAWLPLLGLVAIRVSMALAVLPAPLGSHAPTTVRAALGAMIALAIVLPIGPGRPAIALEPIALAWAAMGEMLVGLALGLVARATLATAEVAGELVGGAMGLSFSSSVDPSSGEPAAIGAHLLGGLGVLVFFSLEGHHAVLAALAASVRAAPPGDAFAAIDTDGIARLGAVLLEDGLRVASPVVATMLVVQLAVGLVARSAPRLQVFTLSFATAASVGLLALHLAAPSMAEALAAIVRELPDRLGALLVPGVG